MRILLVGLVIVVVLLSLAPLANARVGQITKHVLAKGVDTSGSIWKPINVTNAFTQDDSDVYALTDISSFTRTTFAYNWYDPNGNLYYNQSATLDACSTRCQFYAWMQISGKDAALKWGSWRVDLLADGKLLYSDQFTITPIVIEEDAWTFDLNAPMHARINMTITIHSDNGDWNDYTMRTGEQVGNFNAYDYATGKALGVIVTPPTSTQQNTVIKVVFDAPQGDGYRFVLSYDLASAFGYRGTNLFLTWSWSSDIHPQPMNIVVILPVGYTFVSLTGAANYTTTQHGNRVAISFSGTAAPNARLNWSLTYGKVAETSTSSLMSTTAITSTSPTLSSTTLIGVLVVVIIVAIALVVILTRRKSQNRN